MREPPNSSFRSAATAPDLRRMQRPPTAGPATEPRSSPDRACEPQFLISDSAALEEVIARPLCLGLHPHEVRDPTNDPGDRTDPDNLRRLSATSSAPPV